MLHSLEHSDIPVAELLGVFADAGRTVMRVYGQAEMGVKYKGDGSPVTEADLAANSIITEGIQRLMPGLAIVSEEGDLREAEEIVRTQDAYCVVDPLDNTRGFERRQGEFSICGSIVVGGLSAYGIILDPETGTAYFGGANCGSFRKSADGTIEPIRVADNPTDKVMVSRAYPNPETDRYIREHFPRHQRVGVGSALKFTRIAEGLADVMPRLNTHMGIWDVAPGDAILVGAGGIVTDMSGDQMRYASSLTITDFLASR